MTYVYQMSNDELVTNANKALGVVVDGLRIEGYLTEDEATYIQTHYSIILESRSWLPKFLADWLGVKKDAMSLRLVKAIGRNKGEA